MNPKDPYQVQSCVLGDYAIEVNFVDNTGISKDGKVVDVTQRLIDNTLVSELIGDLRETLHQIIDAGYVHRRNPPSSFVGAPAPTRSTSTQSEED